MSILTQAQRDAPVGRGKVWQGLIQGAAADRDENGANAVICCVFYSHGLMSWSKIVLSFCSPRFSKPATAVSLLPIRSTISDNGSPSM